MSAKMPNFEDFHVGNMIITYLNNNNLSQAHLARVLEMPTSNMNRLLKRRSMDTDKLMEISMKLRHNFFADMCGEEDTGDSFVLTAAPIGRHIENRLKDLKITQIKFATMLDVASPEVSRLIKKTSFDVLRLLKISHLLDYNFFQDFYKIKENDNIEDNTFTAVIKRYEQLVIENNKLQSEISVLKQKLKDAGID